ncbi:APC family permease [Millisia brevis]|uniref:APC family permease n=1 Tax=Millisia brevis TaxID=264148 RepID=UPI00082C0CFF|nr:APC family permease [Millisia brevis]
MKQTQEGGSGRLQGSLGPLAIVFIVVAAAAPLTIMVSTPTNMANANGAGMSATYFVAPMLLLLFAGGFAAMSRYVPKAGAFYSYVAAALGRSIGVGAGFTAMGGYFIFQSFVYTLMGLTINETLVSFFGENAVTLPWYVWVFLMIALVGWLGYQEVDVNAKVLAIVLLLEVLVIMVINVAVVARGGGPEGISLTGHLAPDVLFSAPIAISLLIGFSVGLGFEATALFRDEARDPERTIPRAIYITLISAAVFYSISTWALAQAWGTRGISELLAQEPDRQFSLFYETADIWVGSVFSQSVQLLAITSMFACVLAYHNIIARYLHSMGHSVLPLQLTYVHADHKSPYIASLVTSVGGVLITLAWLSTGLDPYVFIGWEIAVGTLSVLIVFVLTSLAIFVFFRRHPDLDRRLWVTGIAPILSFAVLAVIMVTAMLNFSSLSGAADARVLNTVLMLIPPALFCLGVVTAQVAKRRDPDRFQGIV